MNKINYPITLFLFCLVQAVYGVACAQYQLPNSDMERFDNSWAGKGYDPTGWKGANVQRTILNITAGAEMVSPDNNGRNGKCVRIHNERVEAAGIGAVAPSWITLGQPWNELKGIDQQTASAGTHGGIRFAYRPDTLSAWIKSRRVNGEEFNIVYYSWTGSSTNNQYMGQNGHCQTYGPFTDEESDIRVTADGNECGVIGGNAVQVGEGALRSTKNYGEWTQVKIPIVYYNNTVPEKMNVIFSSGHYPHKRENKGVHAGSTLWVDDIELVYSSKVHEIHIIKQGESIPRRIDGVQPDKLDYTYMLGKDATDSDIPQILCYRSGRLLSDAECTVVPAAHLGEPTTVTVNAEDGSSTTTYNIVFVAQLSDNALPNGITVDGVQVAGFNSYLSEYTVEVPYGTPECPAIDILKAEADQRCRVACTGVPGTATVTVMAADTTVTRTYTLHLKHAALSDNTLSDILIDGAPIGNFAPDKNRYVVTLPVGTTHMPTVAAVSAYADGVQRIETVQGQLDDTTTITVTPPKGMARVYTIRYRLALSDNATLQDIQIGGEALENFAADIYHYAYRLPKGTSRLPEITWTKGDAFQTVEKETGGLDGITKITVEAQNGRKQIYRIAFSAEDTDLASLKEIRIGGEPLAGFKPDSLHYGYVLPYGTEKLPDIQCVPTEDDLHVYVANGGIHDSTTVYVTTADGRRSTKYKIGFRTETSSVATLADIAIGGVSLDGFAPDVPEYTYLLPDGTQTCPPITVKKGHEGQRVIIIAPATNGKCTIQVQSQDGIDSREYIIELLQSGNTHEGAQALAEDEGDATLADVTLVQENGQPLAFEFKPQQNEYKIEIPSGSPKVQQPNLPDMYLRARDGQQVLPMPDGQNVNVLVVAADGANYGMYVFRFAPQLSDNAQLQGIVADGLPVADFVPEESDYTVNVSAGTIPTIAYVKGDVFQQVKVETSEYGALLTVNSESGNRMQRYLVRFAQEPSHETGLQSIEINGEPMADFDTDIHHYSFVLPYGTIDVPATHVVKAEAGQTVNVVQAATLNDMTRIEVTAEDGTKATYEIAYTVSESDNARLRAMYINGQPLRLLGNGWTADKAFDPEVMEYVIALQPDEEQPTVTWETEVEESEVRAEVKDRTVSVVVTAQDGSDENEYRIVFTDQLSDDVQLESLRIKGELIVGFRPDSMEYRLLFPVGADETQFPVPSEVDYTAKEGQTVVVMQPEPAVLLIQVRAADGASIGTYVLVSEIALSDNALLCDIRIHGKSLAGFDAEQLEYDYLLPYGSVQMPLDGISYVQGDAYQKVELTPFGNIAEGNAVVYIMVTAQDGTECIYTVSFGVTEDNPSMFPGENDVCLVPLSPDGLWRAASIRSDVQVFLFSVGGRLLSQGTIPVLDPNEKDVMCEHSATITGLEFQLPRKGAVYVFAFVYDGSILRSQKVIW